jgi:flagellar hook-associated protein 1 FlgK
MGVRADLELDPTLLATSYSGATGDNGTLLKLLDLNESGIGGLGNQTLDEGFAEISGSVAQELNATGSALDAEQFLLDSLEARRDQVSGVNVDEELVKLIEFEQAFAAASQYIRVISDLNQELLSII